MLSVCHLLNQPKVATFNHYYIRLLFLDWDPDEVFPLLPAAEAERRRSLQKLRTVVSQHYDEIDSQVVTVDLTKYIFPFENLVFEGGGNKGLAYCGAVRVSHLY